MEGLPIAQAAVGAALAMALGPPGTKQMTTAIAAAARGAAKGAVCAAPCGSGGEGRGHGEPGATKVAAVFDSIQGILLGMCAQGITETKARL